VLAQAAGTQSPAVAYDVDGPRSDRGGDVWDRGPLGQVDTAAREASGIPAGIDLGESDVDGMTEGG
jgi:hypothetical protein